MPDPDPQLERKPNLFNAWFLRLDEEPRGLLPSGRVRVLLLTIALFALIIVLARYFSGAQRIGAIVVSLLAYAAGWYIMTDVILDRQPRVQAVHHAVELN